MPIETKYGTGIQDPTAFPSNPVDAALSYGRIRGLFSTLEVAADALATSTYKLGAVPSAARILDVSKLEFDQLRTVGGNDLDLGDKKFPAGLQANINAGAAGSKTLLDGGDIANKGKRLWELLGYTEDPGGFLELMVTLKLDAQGGGGTLSLDVTYVID